MKRKRVLFLCTGNSCRSQIAEGFLRSVGGDRFEAFSAGARPAGYVHPLAIRAMRELNIDISRHVSKSVDAFQGQSFDYLITLCDDAREACPTHAGAAKQLHWGIDDPAQAPGDDEEVMANFSRVRDEIRRRIELFLAGRHE